MSDNKKYPPPTRLTTLVRRVVPKRIAFLKFILEAYDGLALLSTLDPHEGVVEIRCFPGTEEAVCEIIDSLDVQMTEDR